jgi:PTH2 family peptidyl-tRNA hydrolase
MVGKLIMDNFEYKQVIIFRKDLNLSKGKIAAQAGHAAVSSAMEARIHNKNWYKGWIMEGQRKIAVKVKNEKELLKFKEYAVDLGLPNSLIVDRGLTEIPAGTITCLGIGPAPSEKIDRLTGELKLL